MPSSHGAFALALAIATLSCGRSLRLADLARTQPLELGSVENVRGVLVGAGDIAFCGTSPDDSTGKLVLDVVRAYREQRIPVLVFTAGDNAYPRGTFANYRDCYDPAWGGRELKGITRPTPGNHEYQSRGAAGYYRYFQAAAGDDGKGFYRYDLAGWDIFALNSEVLQKDRSGPTRRRYQPIADEQHHWLGYNLKFPTGNCSLAYWHHPRFNSGPYGHNTTVDSLWQLLYSSGAEIVITGHEHLYERFKPLGSDGTEDREHGITEFVVGTGGADLRKFREGVNTETSERRIDDKYGVLVVALEPDRARWRFIATTGETLDEGTVECHGPASPSPAAFEGPVSVNYRPSSSAQSSRLKRVRLDPWGLLSAGSAATPAAPCGSGGGVARRSASSLLQTSR